MIFKLYRSKTPVSVFTLPILIAVLGLPVFVLPSDSIKFYFEWQNGVFSAIIDKPILNYVLSWALVSTMAHQLNNLFNRNDFYLKSTFLPGLIYALGYVSLGGFYFTPSLLASSFIILGLFPLFKMNRQETAMRPVFNAALFFGLAVCFSPFLFGLLLLVWIALALFRPFHSKEWFLAILGFGIPFFYLVGMHFLFLDKWTLSLSYHNLQLAPDPYRLQEITLWVFMGLLFAYSLLRLPSVMGLHVIRFRKQKMLLGHLTWVCALSLFAGLFILNGIWFSIIVPGSILVSIQMLNAKRDLIPDLILFLWIIFFVANVWNKYTLSA